MPFFKSTYNILTKPDEDEVFDKNWMDRNSVYIPPNKEWDYARELQIEDIDLWEVIEERSGGLGIYAAWDPYAEFYLITTGFDLRNSQYVINGAVYTYKNIETYYGHNATKRVYERAKQLGIVLPIYKKWVDSEAVQTYTN
jgi:hypothetical protein